MVDSVAGDGGRSAAGEVVTRGTSSGDDIPRWWRDRRTSAVQRSSARRALCGVPKSFRTFMVSPMDGPRGRAASEERAGALLVTVFHNHVGFNFPKNPLKS